MYPCTLCYYTPKTPSILVLPPQTTALCTVAYPTQTFAHCMLPNPHPFTVYVTQPRPLHDVCYPTRTTSLCMLNNSDLCIMYFTQPGPLHCVCYSTQSPTLCMLHISDSCTLSIGPSFNPLSLLVKFCHTHLSLQHVTYGTVSSAHQSTLYPAPILRKSDFPRFLGMYFTCI